MISFKGLRLFLFCRVERSENISDHFLAADKRLELIEDSSPATAGSEMTNDAFRFSASMQSTKLHPIRHLLRERALRAIGIVLHAKIFVDLEQPLLVRDSAQKFLPAGIISKKTRRSGFEAPVR